jgi:ribonuclease HI
MKIIIHSDGGARGNPGPAGVGAVVSYGKEKHEISRFIGEATNNQAEYQAVVEALTWVKDNIEEASEIECLLDSELVVKQLNGRYKLKNDGLKMLFWQIRELMTQLGGTVTFQHVLREKNKAADKLVNVALDKAIGK